MVFVTGKMNLQTRKILRIEVTTSFQNEILEEIRKYLEKGQKSKVKSQKNAAKPLVIFTPNPEIISYAQKDGNFAQIVNTAQINLPDGAGVVWALKKLYGIKIERIAGIDLMEDLVNLAEKQRLTIGLIGGRGGVAVDALECLRKKRPTLSGWALEGPEIQMINDKLQMTTELKIANDQMKEIMEKIIKEKTSILFVGFGFPKQEYFIDRLTYHLSLITYHKPIVLMAVGGSFDYLAGRVLRAPLVIRNLGLEWLFRLLIQPWRLPRQLKGVEFFWKVILES